MRVPATFATVLALAIPAKAEAKHVPGCNTSTCDKRIKTRYIAKLKRQAIQPYRVWLSAVRSCESGGDYATNTGNGYYGAYQFDLQTWWSVGGTGYPHQNTRLEQDYRAVVLRRRRGTSPWPVCG